MTDEQEGSEPKSKAREQALAIHLAFLEHWRTELSYDETALQQAADSSREFALTAIRSGYILNGGGLVALPAFLQLFQPTQPDNWTVGLAMILFIVGLILCAGANYLGYLSAGTQGEAHRLARSMHGLDVREIYYPNQDRRSVAGTKSELAASSRKAFKRAWNYARVARGMYLTSLGLFVAGGIVGWTLWVRIGKASLMQFTETVVELTKILAWVVSLSVV